MPTGLCAVKLVSAAGVLLVTQCDKSLVYF